MRCVTRSPSGFLANFAICGFHHALVKLALFRILLSLEAVAAGHGSEQNAFDGGHTIPVELPLQLVGLLVLLPNPHAASLVRHLLVEVGVACDCKKMPSEL